MKKKDIIKIIKAKSIIEDNKDLLSMIKKSSCMNEEYHYLKEDFWFPNILELKSQFEVLKKELKKAKKDVEEAETLIKQTSCSHEVRLRHYWSLSSEYRCVLCGYKTLADNCFNWKDSIYRNKHMISFPAKYQEDEDLSYIEDGKTEKELLNIIIEILKNYNDEDEVDLVEEISKLNLKKAEVNKEKRKQENYILLIGGTNLEYVNKKQGTYLTKNSSLISLDFLKYFHSLLDTKIAIIDREETLNNSMYQEFKNNRMINIQPFTSLEHLNIILKGLKNIPFHIIIDLSDLYHYEIKDGYINEEEYHLNLKEQFPNSHMIRIGNFSMNREEKIKEFLSKYQDIDKVYAYDNHNYYFLESNNVKYDNLENTCGKIKRLLRK